MFCKNCGKEVGEAAVCPHCGAAVTAAVQPQSNGMAVAGFVCSFLFPFLGWIFGGIGLSRSKQRGGKGKGLSIAALVIATLNFILGVVLQMTVLQNLV